MTATIFDVEEQICAIRILELPLASMAATVQRIESNRVLECAKMLAEDKPPGSPRPDYDRLTKASVIGLELRRRDPAG